MKITLFLNDKLIDFKLPNIISGSYSFDPNEKEESKLINIEANDGRWILYETSDVKIVTNNGISNKVSVDVNSFYVLKRNNINYLIYVSNLKFNSIKAYSYNTDINLIIGNINDATIKYDLQYLK